MLCATAEAEAPEDNAIPLPGIRIEGSSDRANGPGGYPYPVPVSSERKSRYRVLTLTPGGPLMESPILARVDYYRGLRAVAAGDEPAAREFFESCTQRDPSLIRSYFLLAYVYLREFDWKWTVALSRAAEALSGNFRSQSLLMTNGVIFFFLIAFIGTMSILATILVRCLPTFRHAILEWLPDTLPPLMKELYAPVAVVSLFLLFHPWVWPSGLVWMLSAGALLSWRALRSWERGVALGFLMQVGLAPLILKIAIGTSLPAMPDSTLYALSGSSIVPPAGEVNRGGQALPLSDDIHFSYALLERERGNYRSALAHYDEMIQSGHGSPAVHNNRGNLLFLLGRGDEALASYEEALAYHPDDAVARYNLGMLQLETFQFDEANVSFTKASQIDFTMVRALSQLSGSEHDATLVDECMTPGQLWGRFLAGKTGKQGATWGESWHAAKRLLFPFSPFAVLPLAAVLGFSYWFGKTRPRPGRCHFCRRSICQKCRVRQERLDVCPTCAAQEPEMCWAERTLHFHRPTALSLGIMMPGLTHLYLGNYRRGLPYFLLTLMVLLLWAFRGAVVKPFPVLSPPDMAPLENMFFGWIFTPIYVWILLDGLRLIRTHFRSGAERGGKR